MRALSSRFLGPTKGAGPRNDTLARFSGILLGAFLCASAVSAGSLYDQAVDRLLERRFSGEDISYLLLDARTGTVRSSRWEEPGPFGSLIKPFTALAYAQTHGFRYPEQVCSGSGCWLPRGHGRIGIREAIAKSCNAYFRALAAEVRAEDVAGVMRRFGMQGVRENAPAAALIGLGEDWKAAPLEIARAYSELATRANEPGADELLRGMALSARSGTGSAVGRALAGEGALVKTGTALCIHIHRQPGDGYVMTLYPEERPTFALLVRVHGAPGAKAAAVAGEMLRAVLEGK